MGTDFRARNKKGAVMIFFTTDYTIGASSLPQEDCVILVTKGKFKGVTRRGFLTDAKGEECRADIEFFALNLPEAIVCAPPD